MASHFSNQVARFNDRGEFVEVMTSVSKPTSVLLTGSELWTLSIDDLIAHSVDLDSPLPNDAGDDAVNPNVPVRTHGWHTAASMTLGSETGHIYMANFLDSEVRVYDSSGSSLSARTVTGLNQDLRGITTAVDFGPDAMLVGVADAQLEWWQNSYVLVVFWLVVLVTAGLWIYPYFSYLGTKIIPKISRRFAGGTDAGMSYLPNARKALATSCGIMIVFNLLMYIGIRSCILCWSLTIPVGMAVGTVGICVSQKPINTHVVAFRRTLKVAMVLFAVSMVTLTTTVFHCDYAFRLPFGSFSWNFGLTFYNASTCSAYRTSPWVFIYAGVWSLFVISSYGSLLYFTNRVYKIVKNQVYFDDGVDHYVPSAPMSVGLSLGRPRPRSLTEVENALFQAKREKFKAHNSPSQGECHLTVRRPFVVEDAFTQIMSKKPEELKRSLKVVFAGEPGQDYGGVKREFFQAVGVKLFDPNYGLFVYSAIDSYTFQPNPASAIVHEDHIMWFKFVGRLLAMALMQNCYVPVYFVRHMYKSLLGRKMSLTDVEAIDPDYHRSLRWMIDNDITGVLDQTFEVEWDDPFGQHHVTQLKENGANIEVTEANKIEYVKLAIKWRLQRDTEAQISAFKRSFFELVPKSEVNMFDIHELETMIAGITVVDIKDWANNTEYGGGYGKRHQVIKWWWKYVDSLSNADRAKLLQFCTGTSMVPIEGFAGLQGSNGPQKFQIKRLNEDNRLPSAHTCFNQLDLPRYKTYDQLKEKVTQAMTETSGFEFV